MKLIAVLQITSKYDFWYSLTKICHDLRRKQSANLPKWGTIYRQKNFIKTMCIPGNYKYVASSGSVWHFWQQLEMWQGMCNLMILSSAKFTKNYCLKLLRNRKTVGEKLLLATYVFEHLGAILFVHHLFKQKSLNFWLFCSKHTEECWKATCGRKTFLNVCVCLAVGGEGWSLCWLWRPLPPPIPLLLLSLSCFNTTYLLELFMQPKSA